MKHVEELPLKPSKLPAGLALFVRKYMVVVGLIICFGTILLFATGIIEQSRSDDYTGLYLILGGLGIAILGIFLMRRGVGNPGRETREYVKPDGEYDIETPRKYSALAYNLIHRSATFGPKSNALKEFIFCDGSIYVETQNGATFEAPMKDIVYSYLVIGDGYKFIITSGNNKIGFFKAESMLEDEEWEDIHNLLMRTNYIGETKGSQAIGIGTKILQVVMSLSGSGGNSSWSDVAGDTVGGVAESLGKMKILGNYVKDTNYFA